jgi:hypothetical protein
MAGRRLQRLIIATLAAWLAANVSAAEGCGYLSTQSLPATYPARIAAVACGENALWFGPFIDSTGRLASTRVAEAEATRLKDGATPTWRRVVDYWKGSGLLWQMDSFPGAVDCSYGSEAHVQAASCRAFLIDNPWSAVFVSYVMNRAGVPGFRASASHVDYVRDAYLHPETSPFQFADPDTQKPTAGDLLCFARQNAVALGYQGMKSFLDRTPAESLNMHCDIVVAADPASGKLHLVGGNVLQGVTLRLLNLNRNGQLWGLPRRTGVEADCGPGNEAACSFNRQDWVALLKLRPMQAPVQRLQVPAAPHGNCCEVCPLPMPPGVRRCGTPSPSIGPDGSR